MVYGNLPPSSNAVDPTTDFFNNFFVKGMSTSSNIDDAVIGYFQSVTGNAESGAALAASVLYTALSQGSDPMEIVDQFRKVPSQELSAFLTMFLNSNRIGTSLLGLTNSPQTNRYITRAILA